MISGSGISGSGISGSGSGGGGISATAVSKISLEPPYMELATSSAAGSEGAAGIAESPPKPLTLGE